MLQVYNMKGCCRFVVFDHRRAIVEMDGRLSMEVAQLLGMGSVYEEAYYTKRSTGFYQRCETKLTSDEGLSKGVLRGETEDGDGEWSGGCGL